MNTKLRTTLQPIKAPVVDNKVKAEMEGSKPNNIPKAVKNRLPGSRERKVALQQDVDKLKKKLRHEETVHRALERAFNRPLGTLPRLPPYLPPVTLELLAEVAVLEEEIVRLEEKVVHFRQDLYREAVYISNFKRNIESFADLHHLHPNKNPKEQSRSSVQNLGPSMVSKTKPFPSSGSGKLDEPSCDDVKGKENEGSNDSVKNYKRASIYDVQPSRTPVKWPPKDNRSVEKNLETHNLQLVCRTREPENVEASGPNTRGEQPPGNNGPNKVSEDIVKCLCSIFKRMSSIKNRQTAENLPFLSTLVNLENVEGIELQDPYGICSEFGARDIGPYKHLLTIEAGTVNLNRTSNSLFLLHRLKLLLGKLACVNLQNLTHQEKLAFWINIYNSCMMNAYLEYGIPEDPEMVVALMQKAKINVGGHLLNALTIEHFILRLPYHSRYGAKNDEMTVRSKFGLELSEPLVTFALSCGSWSSPAVRVYTASEVENELEAAKRDYLQAAIRVSTRKFAIPKLLDWYLLDFAKDFESLLDWICLQLPNELGKEAIKCLERGKAEPYSQFVQVMPYEFSFRYLLCT